jgi:hypothetical protein
MRGNFFTTFYYGIISVILQKALNPCKPITKVWQQKIRQLPTHQGVVARYLRGNLPKQPP